MSISKVAYNLLFKRTSTFTLTIITGAFIFERTIDLGVSELYGYLNKGVNTHLYIYEKLFCFCLLIFDSFLRIISQMMKI